MTLEEFRIAVDAFGYRNEMQHHMLAWHAANIMNMWTKKGKRIRPRDLLKPKEETISFSRGGGESESKLFDEYMRAKLKRSNGEG